MVHLTEKPVELARRAIEYSSLPGEAVLDPFAGSRRGAAPGILDVGSAESSK